MTAPNTNDAAGLTIVPAPAGPPPKSAVTIASEKAREAIAAGQPLATAAPAAAAPAPAAAPPAGQAAPAAQPPVPGTGQPAAPAKPAEGQPAPKPEEGQQPAETDAERAAREAAEALQVELPIGETEDDHLIITAESPETAEQLRQLVEVAVEGRLATEELANARAAVSQTEELREYADADPVGFTLDMIGTDLDRAKALTMFLLTQPTLFAAVKDDLAKLSDPTQFKLLAADAREQRRELADTANERIETSRVVRQNLQDIQSTVSAMLPETLTPAQRQVAMMDCLRDLKDYADNKELLVLPVNQVPAVLQHRLAALGIDPEAATARAVAAVARKGGPISTPRMSRVAAPVTRAPAATSAPPAPKKDGTAFVTSAARRKDAASIPNGGAGSPSTAAGIVAPRDKDGKPLGIKDTLAWHREQRKKGVRLW